MLRTREIDIVLDSVNDTFHFIELEDTKTKRAVSLGKFIARDDGYNAIRLNVIDTNEDN